MSLFAANCHFSAQDLLKTQIKNNNHFSPQRRKRKGRRKTGYAGSKPCSGGCL
jgi:hypothetical protein